MSSRRPLGEILVQRGWVDEDTLDASLASQQGADAGHRIGAVLEAKGLVSREEVCRALAEQAGLPYVDPLVEPVDPAVVWRIPRKFAERHGVIALGLSPSGAVRVAVSDPNDLNIMQDIQFTVDASVQTEIAAPELIQRAIARHYDLDGMARQMLADIPEARRAPVTSPTALELDSAAIHARLSKGSGQPYVDLLDFLLVNAVERRASDIHLEPELEHVRVRYRVDGMLRDALTLPAWACAPLVGRIKAVAGMDTYEHRRPMDGTAVIKLGERAIDLRVSTVPSQYGESVGIRVLDIAMTRQDLRILGWRDADTVAWMKLVSQPQGLVLVVGPTGSGKSTTLYATLQRLMGETRSIVTLEDPIEYRLPGVSQIQVDERVGMDFPTGIRSLLRQDPDVMVIGEIRDEESAHAAVSAATTGHLVLSTLHTSNAIATLTRLEDLAVPRYLLVSGLLGVLAQRLVRKVCGDCSLPFRPMPEDWARLDVAQRSLGHGARRVGPGCPSCQYTGFSGRIAVYELLRLTDDLREVFQEGGSERELWEVARAEGLNSMMDDALDKVAEGLTTLDEVARVIPVDRYGARSRAVQLVGEGVSSAQTPVPVTESGFVLDEPDRDEATLDDFVTFDPDEIPEDTTLDEETESVRAQPVEAPAARPQPVVLVVDDSAEILRLVQITLEDEYEVRVAADGVEALEAIDEAIPDAVVLDVMMPRMSGYEVCRVLKEDPETEDLPVLMLSARGDASHVKEGFYAGADDYLPKPFDPEELGLRIRALLRRSGRLGRD